MSTLLPFDVADKQHLERKRFNMEKRRKGNGACLKVLTYSFLFFRHLGNDVCVVIFIDIPEEEEMKEWEVREGQENGEEDKNQEEKGNEEKKEDTIKRGLFHPASISSHFNHVFLVVSVNHRATREMFVFYVEGDLCFLLTFEIAGDPRTTTLPLLTNQEFGLLSHLFMMNQWGKMKQQDRFFRALEE